MQTTSSTTAGLTNPGQGGQGNLYQRFIQPDHPFVQDFFRDDSGAVPTDLAGAVAHLAHHTRYTNARGSTSFETYAKRFNAAPEEPLVMNCQGFTALLVSFLRARGWSARDVFVAMAGEKGKTEYHAWALVRASKGFYYWINPCLPRLERRTGLDLAETYNLHALFNDQQLLFGSEEKRALLVPDTVTAPRFILFGKTQSGLQTALQNLVDGKESSPALFAEKQLPAGLVPEAEADLLREHGMLQNAGDKLIAGRSLTVIPAAAELRFHHITDPFMTTYCTLVAETVPHLKTCFEQHLEVPGSFTWDIVVHTVVAGMLVDLAVANLLTERGFLAADIQKTEAWAFELDLAGEAFGVQSVNHGKRRLAQLWHRRVPRTLRVPPQQVAQLVDLAAGNDGALNPRDRLYLTHLGLVGRTESGYQAKPPFFSPAAITLLHPILESGAEQLVNRAILPSLDAAAKDPAWQALDHNPALRHAAIRLLLEQGMARLVDAGVLPPFPSGEEAPTTWGRWLWEDPETTGLVAAMDSQHGKEVPL